MKKIIASVIALLAVACIAIGLRAATAETTTDLSHVKVTAYRGSTHLHVRPRLCVCLLCASTRCENPHRQ